MIRIIAVLVGLAGLSGGATVDAALRAKLEQTYKAWRQAIVSKDARAWQAATATHRQMSVRNRIVSEKRAFPQAIFDLPAAPPALAGLRAVQVMASGATARAVYFGKVDFNVGGEPSDNLLLLSFTNEGGRWKYDTADFVNLGGLPDVRRELLGGNDKYVEDTAAFRPDGKVPPTARPVAPAKYISKVYVFCPGREVQVHVNKVSRHRFVNAKEAEIIIGGARDGVNEIQYSVKGAEGGKGNEAMTIRVYLFSQKPGVKPVKVYEYQVNEGEKPEGVGSANFVIDANVAAKVMGR
jgi:hypothetical protein